MSRSLLLATGGASPPTVVIAPATLFSIGLDLEATFGGGPYSGLRWQRNTAYGLTPVENAFADIGGEIADTKVVVAADMGFGVRIAVDWSGGTVYSNVLRFEYVTRAAVLEGCEFSKLAGGAVAALVGEKTGLSLAQPVAGARPVKSGTGLLTFDGIDDCLYTAVATALFNGQTGVRGVVRPTFPNVGTQILYELSSSFGSFDGAFGAGAGFLGPADPTLAAGSRGTAALGLCNTFAIGAVETVVSYGNTTTSTDGVAFIREGGAENHAVVVNTCGPGPFGTYAFTFGARDGGGAPSLFFSGTTKGGLYYLSGTAQDADLIDLEAYIGNCPI